MQKARTALGQNGRGTLWNDEGTDSCAGQNGQHDPNPGAHLYIYVKTWTPDIKSINNLRYHFEQPDIFRKML